MTDRARAYSGGSQSPLRAYKLPIQRESAPTLYRLFRAQPQEWPASLYLLEGETGRSLTRGSRDPLPRDSQQNQPPHRI